MRLEGLTAVTFLRRRMLGVVVAAAFCALLAGAQSVADATALRIQILNGKTGRPVANQHFVLSDKGGRVIDGMDKAGETTDGEGYAPIPTGETPVADIFISVGSYRPCSKTEKRDFALEKVRASGVVSENSCSSRITMYPQAGTLIYYVREEGFFEKMLH